MLLRKVVYNYWLILCKRTSFPLKSQYLFSWIWFGMLSHELHAFFFNFIPWKTVYLLDITSIKEESGRVCVHRNTILLGKLCNGCRFSASIEFRTASQYYSLCWLVLNSVVVTHWLWLLLVRWSRFWQLETKHRSFASKSKQPSRLIQTAVFFYYYLCWH